MTKVEISEALAVIAASYSSFEVTPARINIWFELFKSADKEAFMAALKDHLLCSKFAPAIAEINEALNKPDYPDMMSAWSEVRYKIGRIGYYGSPTFTHPAIAAAVKAFGWQNLCDMENPDVTRSNFIKMYQSYCQRGVNYALLNEGHELEEGQSNELTDGIVKDIEDDFKPDRQEQP